jgi:hypothetical protein
VAAAAAHARDVTLVINNAGVGQPGGFLAPDGEESARRPLALTRFDPCLLIGIDPSKSAWHAGG